jgi:hypothetical protein
VETASSAADADVADKIDVAEDAGEEEEAAAAVAEEEGTADLGIREGLLSSSVSIAEGTSSAVSSSDAISGAEHASGTRSSSFFDAFMIGQLKSQEGEEGRCVSVSVSVSVSE